MKQHLIKWINTFSILFLAAALVVSVSLITVTQSAIAVWDGTVATAFASGSGTENDPYLIETESQLGFFLSELNNGVTYEGLYIQLNNDLDMTGSTWTAAGTFSGVFDGYGHTITADCSFLSSIGSAGTVKRLIYAVEPTLATAPLTCTNSGLIESCVVYGDVSGGSYTGMICDTNSGIVRNCGGIGSVYAYDADGVDVGMIGYFSSGTIEHCYSAMTARGGGGGKYSLADVGPLYGRAYSSSCVISDCYYNSTLYTSSCSQGAGLSTEEMTSESFTETMNSSLYAGCYWVQSAADSLFAGYPLPTPCYDATASLEYTAEKVDTYHTSTLSTTLTATGSGTIYYTLDGSNPITSSTRKTYSSGSTLTLSGDVTVRSVVYYGGEYSAVNTQKLIQLLGGGTESDPYLIYNKTQLDAVRLDTAASYQLMNDLTFTDEDYLSSGVAPGGWTSIKAFSGTFNGNAHSISGLYGTNGGLFESNTGTIENLRIIDHRLFDDSCIGAVANSNSGSVLRCYTKSAFTIDDLPSPATDVISIHSGGVVGSNSGTVKYCWNDGLVYGTSTYRYNWIYVGGIVGQGKAENCYNTGDVVIKSTTTTEYAYAGGISSNGSSCTNCRNDGSIYLDTALDYDQYTGGISTGDWAELCVVGNNTVTVIGGDRTHKVTYSNTPSDCYNLSTRLYSGEYPELDFDTVWMMTENGPLPQGLMDADGTCLVLRAAQVEPNCTETGVIHYEDALTGTYHSTWTVPALGHNYGSWTPIDGSDLHIHTCSFSGCGNFETAAHTWEAVNVIAPTCTADGYTDYACVCDLTKTEIDGGSALGHAFTNYFPDGNATCTEDGTKTAQCDYGCTATDTLPDDGSALGHSFTVYNSNVDATCVSDGTETATCDNSCGETDTRVVPGSALGHSFTKYTSNNDATCTADGTKTASCDNDCGESDTQPDVGSKQSHSYTSYTANGDATCTANGTKTAYCDFGCGASETLPDTDSALGHSFTVYTSNNDATCAQDGTETSVCDRTGCNEADTRTAEGSMVSHSFTAYASNGDATCTADGTKTASCDFGCGTTDTLPDEGSMLEHSWSAPDANFTMTCSVCGATQVTDTISGTTSDGFSWTLTNTGHLTVSGTGILTDGSVWSTYASSIQTLTLESGIDGLDEAVFENLDELPALNILNLSNTVTELEPSVLNDYCPKLNYIAVDTDNSVYSTNNGILYNKSQTTLVLYPVGKTEAVYIMPSTVTAIELDAFTGCDQITTITLSANLKSVDEATFRSCTALQNIYLDNANTHFTCDSNVALIRNEDNGLISYCVGNTQTSYTVPDGVEIICEYAFYNAAHLTTVTLPLSLTEVEYGVFIGCSALSEASYPGTEAYWNTVEIGNKNDLLLDAITFGIIDTMTGTCGKSLTWTLEMSTGKLTISGSGDMTSAPWNKALVQSIVFDGSITTICDNAFSHCSNLTAVTIPDSVISIGQDAFFLSGLTSVVVPDSVTFLGESAFDYCKSLTNAVIGNGVTTIIDNTFENCSSLTEVTIPKSITDIGDDAFYNCPLETVYYTGSEPQWGLVSIANGNISLLTADHIYASYLLVEWNSSHTVLSISGMVDGSAYVTAAFYDTSGQMQLAKHYTATQVKSGVGISDSSVDLSQCTATIMVLDEKYAPVGVPYTPDAPEYLYESLWLFATEHAYIDGGQKAGADKLLFSDGAVTHEVDASLCKLGVWNLGQRYVLVIDSATNHVISVQSSGDSSADSCRLMDIDTEIMYGTSSNQANNKYSFTIGAVEGIFTDDEIPCLVLDSTSAGVPTTISATELYELAGAYSSDEYRAIDRNNDGEIDYLIVQPYTYAFVDTIATSKYYGDYMQLTATDGTALQDFNGNTRWYIADTTNLDELPEEDAILKMSWNLEEDIYEVDILSPVTASYEKRSVKGLHTFAGEKYYLANNGWDLTNVLATPGLGAAYIIMTDDNLLVYAEPVDTSLQTMEDINAQLCLVTDTYILDLAGNSESNAIEYLNIDGEIMEAVYRDLDTDANADGAADYVQFSELSTLISNTGKDGLKDRLFLFHTNTDGTVYLEKLQADVINTQLNASTALLDGYAIEEGILEITDSGAIFCSNRISDDCLFFVAALDTEGTAEFGVMTAADFGLGSDASAYGMVLVRVGRTYDTIVGGYFVFTQAAFQ